MATEALCEVCGFPVAPGTDFVCAACMEDDEESMQPEDGDYYVTAAGPLGSKTAVGVVGGKSIGVFGTDGDALETIRDLMEREQYWPNVWRVSDHGNWDIATF